MPLQLDKLPFIHSLKISILFSVKGLLYVTSD